MSAVNLLGILADRLYSGIDSLLDAIFQNHRIRSGGYVLHAFPDQGLGKQSSGSGTVAGHVVGLGSDLLDQLSAHVLKSVIQFNFLGDGYAVVGDKGSAELFVQHHVSSLGS